MTMLVFLNPTAGGGAAWQRWQAVRPELEAGVLRPEYDLVTDRAELERRLAAAPAAGGVLVAAGGDGTVNVAASSLMQLPDTERCRWRLGAVGLGSSNDFHKPRPPSRRGRPPVRLDVAGARARPVGQVDFVDEHGTARRCHFLINASVGIVALGNHLFNVEDGVLRLLKPRWTAAAIWYAAIRAVFGGRDVPARLTVDDTAWWARVTNAHVLLSSHVSGGLHYDFCVPSERAFALALCEGLGPLARARTLLSLARGRFGGVPGTRVLTARRLEIDTAEPTPLETDGEVRLAAAIRIRHLPGALTLCA